MHIGTLHFYNRSFPPEIRLEKESIALADAGHKITILTQRTSSEQLEQEKYSKNFYIKRVKINPLSGYKNVVSRFSLFFSNYIPQLKNFIEFERPDVLHVHDLGPIPTVLEVAKEYNLPVIADLHENMPAALVAWRRNDPIVKRFIRSISLNYRVWRWHEARALSKCHKILVVVPEAAERLYRYGIPKSEILVVSNTEDETTFKNYPEQADQSILNKYNNKFVVSYIGGLGPHRGIDTTLKSLPYIRNKIPNFKLLVVGANDEQIKNIIAEAKSFEMEKYVSVVGWQPFERVNSYVMASNVCLVPHNNFEHTQTTVPHKLFQYMICKKPVLVSDCKPLKRIVEETNAGSVFRANDSKDLAAKLIKMHESPDKLILMGECGKKAALGKYAWRNDAKKLVQMYSELEQNLSNS